MLSGSGESRRPISEEPRAATQSTRLSGIQALRGVAATAVLLYHAARHVDKVFAAPELIRILQSGHAGVDLFFIISGFIILFVHRRDIGEPGHLPHYLGRRFNRVFPLYWIALVLTVAMGFAGHHPLPALPEFLWSAALLPTLDEPILGIAWTLQFELVFYAAFAVLLLHRRIGVTLFAAWLIWIAVANSGLLDTSMIAAPLWKISSLEFFFGMAVAMVLHRMTIPAPRLLAAAGLASFLVAMVLESTGILDGYGVAARLVYGGAAGLLVAGLTAAEQSGQVTTPKWLEMLGEASYSIYIFQFVFIGAVWQILLKAGISQRLPHLALFLILSGVALAGGILMSRAVERPLLRIIRGKRTAS